MGTCVNFLNITKNITEIFFIYFRWGKVESDREREKGKEVGKYRELKKEKFLATTIHLLATFVTGLHHHHPTLSI